jgi:hypothetical protein
MMAAFPPLPGEQRTSTRALIRVASVLWVHDLVQGDALIAARNCAPIEIDQRHFCRPLLGGTAPIDQAGAQLITRSTHLGQFAFRPRAAKRVAGEVGLSFGVAGHHAFRCQQTRGRSRILALSLASRPLIASSALTSPRNSATSLRSAAMALSTRVRSRLRSLFGNVPRDQQGAASDPVEHIVGECGRNCGLRWRGAGLGSGSGACTLRITLATAASRMSASCSAQAVSIALISLGSSALMGSPLHRPMSSQPGDCFQRVLERLPLPAFLGARR